HVRRSRQNILELVISFWGALNDQSGNSVDWQICMKLFSFVILLELPIHFMGGTRYADIAELGFK
ncbi:MAG: hypothetical protein ACXWIN_10410, partial [Burkholderiaceae bacterium]